MTEPHPRLVNKHSRKMAAQNLPNIKRINPGLAGRCSSTTDGAYRPPGFPVFLCDASKQINHPQLTPKLDSSGSSCERSFIFYRRYHLLPIFGELLHLFNHALGGPGRAWTSSPFGWTYREEPAGRVVSMMEQFDWKVFFPSVAVCVYIQFSHAEAMVADRLKTGEQAFV